MATALCSFCGTTLQPNSMYCLGCGQLVQRPRDDSDQVADGWTPVPRRPSRPASSNVPTDPEPAASGDPAPLPAPAAPTHWSAHVELRLSTGARTVVSGSTVLGRKPDQTATNIGAQAVEIDDPSRSVSRVHLFLELEEGVLSARDAGSSNGSFVERSGRRIPLSIGGEEIEVHPGDVLWIGDVRADLSSVSV